MEMGEPIVTEKKFAEGSIDSDALVAVQRLQKAGHIAYLVGGGVRDLLLGRQPKDFDVATSAEPRVVRSLFRNARLIGRRFQIVHLHYGLKNIEVACFRKRVPPPGGGPRRPLQAEDAYGTPRDDALARDFTVNALFYDPVKYQILDHVGGIADLQAMVLKTIGDPSIWFYEDPVRILRAAKFVGRLGFSLPEPARLAMRERASLLDICPPSRVNEEIFRILESGSSAEAFRTLWQSGVLSALLPEIQEHLGAAEGPAATLFFRLLQTADRLGRAHGQLSRDFLYTLLWYLPAIERLRAPQSPATTEPWGACTEAWLQARALKMQIPRASRTHQRNLLNAMQRMLAGPERFRRSVGRFVRQTVFADALTLLRLHFRLFHEGAAVYELLRTRAHLAVGSSARRSISRGSKRHRHD